MKRVFALLLALALCCLPCGCAAEDAPPDIPQETIERQEPACQVILLAGEDNCMGYSYAQALCDRDVETNVSPAKYAEYRAGYDNVLIRYRNVKKPRLLNSGVQEFVPVRFGQGFIPAEWRKDGTFGAELGLAEYFSYRFPQQNSYIIKYCGGTASGVSGRWDVHNGEYYLEMLDFFLESLALLEREGVRFEVSAFCLVQGESDAKNNAAAHYEEVKAIADGVLSACGKYAPAAGTAFINVGVPQYFTGYAQLNEAKRALAQTDEKYYYIDVAQAGLTRSQDGRDRKHYDAISQLKLGNILGRTVHDSLDVCVKGDALTLQTGMAVSDGAAPSGVQLACVAGGKAAQSVWAFSCDESTLRLVVRVEDDCVTAGDGVEVHVSEAARSLDYAQGAFSVKASAVGNVSIIDLNSGQSLDTPLSVALSYLAEGENIVGYEFDFAIPQPFGRACAVSFALQNDNGSVNRTVFAQLGAEEGKPYTYMPVSEAGLSQGYAQYGMMLGDGGALKAKPVWDLSHDDGSAQAYAVMTADASDNELYFHKSNAIDLYVAANFEALGVHAGELWGKFGLTITTSEDSGLFFFVDAYGNGREMLGARFGYVTFTHGTYNEDWTDLGTVEGFSAQSYQGGNSVRLALRRSRDRYDFIVEGKTVASLRDPCKIGILPAYAGVASFHISMRLTQYVLEF